MLPPVSCTHKGDSPPLHGRSLAAPETKWTAAPLASLDGDGIFTGYASLFGHPDLARDVMEPGAFTATLARARPGSIKLLYQHDPAQPIGEWLDLREDARGLKVTGRLIPEITRAREVLTLLRTGVIDGLSIGFRAVKARKDTRTGLRRLFEVDLWEISVVTFPMLPAARIAEVKAGEQALVRDLRRASALLRG